MNLALATLRLEIAICSFFLSLGWAEGVGVGKHFPDFGSGGLEQSPIWLCGWFGGAGHLFVSLFICLGDICTRVPLGHCLSCPCSHPLVELRRCAATPLVVRTTATSRNSRGDGSRRRCAYLIRRIIEGGDS